MQTVLEQAITATEREAAHIEASGHITMMSRLPPRCIPSKSSVTRGTKLYVP
jgi:hypothetical protein